MDVCEPTPCVLEYTGKLMFNYAIGLSLRVRNRKNIYFFISQIKDAVGTQKNRLRLLF